MNEEIKEWWISTKMNQQRFIEENRNKIEEHIQSVIWGPECLI